MTITRDFYYVAWQKHVVHFRNECPSYLKSYHHATPSGGRFSMAQPKGKTLCDHCQAIEKRLKRIAKLNAKVEARNARADEMAGKARRAKSG